MNTITPQQLHDRLEQNEKTFILDVRTPAEYSEVHVLGSTPFPLNRITHESLSLETAFTKDQPLYIFCHSGTRAKIAAEKLQKAGYHSCIVVEGGIAAWIQGGFSVIRGTQKTISIERQVRIAAGSLVLIGVLSALFINPSFIFLSGFIGAGLIFAGLTDWCGMGLLIARMPWNGEK